MSAPLSRPRLLTVEQPPAHWQIEWGEMVAVPTVQASNIVRDVREIVTNALGGRMSRYEALLTLTLEQSREAFCAELQRQGYDGALGVRYASSTIVQGGAEFVIYGTGFRFLSPPPESGQ
ncbi:MAG: heavy metal-binding domain-containing protein [Neomegalonema sp.]|nr:heavy metal-binding domain-containing protein [Neomegalonema sp.]